MDQNQNPYENPENNTNPNPYEYPRYNRQNYGSSNYSNPNYGNQNYRNYRNANPMETIAFMLGLGSIVTCSCCYLSLPMGGVAIVLALLSRGGNMKLGTKAKIAIAAGIVGIVFTVIAYTVSFYIAINEYGSIEGILRAYCDQVGLDYEALYGDMFQ